MRLSSDINKSAMWRLLAGLLVCTDVVAALVIQCFGQVPAGALQRSAQLEANCSSRRSLQMSQLTDWLSPYRDTLNALLLQHNGLTAVDRLPRLASLRQLILSHNRIEYIASGAIVDLPNVELLDLSFNRLTSDNVRADILRGDYSPDRYEPSAINSLFLGHNSIHSLGRRSFEHLSSLRHLRLNDNPIENIDLQTLLALQSLKQLKILDLSNCGLSDLPADLLHTLTLESLHLSGNRLMRVPESLSLLGPTLTTLDLNNNPLETLDSRSFQGLVTLRHLGLSAMPQLRAIRAGTFSPLKQLQTLSCSYNPRLELIDKEAFVGLKTSWPIYKLNLNNNGLKWVSRSMAPWHQLAVITLEGNAWLCDCHLHWLVHFLNARNASEDDRLFAVRCAEPPLVKGRKVQSLDLPACPGRPRGHPTLLMRILFGTCISLAFLFLACLLCCRSLRGYVATRVAFPSCLQPGRVRYTKADPC